MQSITSRRDRAGLRRTLWIVLALGLVSPVIASCTNGGSASHRSNNSARTSTATRVHNLLACLTAACQAGPGGEPKKVIPPPRSGGGPASPGSPVARFDWSMPPRFDASWDAWGVYDQAGVGLEGGLKVAWLKDYDPAFVNPRHWNPSFNACTSAAGGSPPASFQWGLWRDGREIDTAKTSSCKLGNHPTDPPAQRLDAPALGSYLVTLSVTNRDGKSASTVQEVTVRDLLVVTFGDSSASGEGNKASSGWEDRQCHRSRTSGPALAAQYLEHADPKTSVTYLNLACSGASVTSGIIGPYEGQEIGLVDFVPLEPQTDALVRAICGGRPAWRCQPSQQRPVDILTINIGVNDLGFSSLLADCDGFGACLEHNWDTALHKGINDFVIHNRTAPSCKTAQQRFEEIPGDDQAAALSRGAALRQANKYCDTANWGHGFQYIADRLKDEGVKVAQTYMSTYPVNFLSGGEGQPKSERETTSGCGLLHNVGQDEAEFMTHWGYVLNYVILKEAVRLGWYPVRLVPVPFRGHGYCARNAAGAGDSFFVSFTESTWNQGNRDGTAHPNRRGHNAWATKYLEAIAAPKPTPAPEFTVRVHLDTFRIFLPGVGPEGSNGACNGNLATGVPVNLFADATLTEAGFGKPVAQATYQVRMKPVRFQFQPSEWYQFPSDVALTFPLSSVDYGLHVTIASPLCHASPSEPQYEFIQIHRPRPYPPDGSDLAGPFRLRSSPDTRAIEVSGCIDVVSTAPQLPPLHPGLVFPCHGGQLATVTS